MDSLTNSGRPARWKTAAATLGFSILLAAQPASAAYLLEIDTDGTDDGVLTFNANFSFGNDTTTASQSVAAVAFGTTGGDSIFGGDGSSFLDTYVYTYTPSSDADNLAIPPGTDLGSGNLATGGIGGGVGPYRVYVLWPNTNNVSGGDTRYTISTPGATDVVTDVDQNAGGAGGGNEWVPIGDITMTDPMAAITVTQQPTGSNSFISMRAYAVLFEALAPPPAAPGPGPAPGAGEPQVIPTLGGAALWLLTVLTGIVGARRLRKPA